MLPCVAHTYKLITKQAVPELYEEGGKIFTHIMHVLSMSNTTGLVVVFQVEVIRHTLSFPFLAQIIPLMVYKVCEIPKKALILGYAEMTLEGISLIFAC